MKEYTSTKPLLADETKTVIDTIMAAADHPAIKFISFAVSAYQSQQQTQLLSQVVAQLFRMQEFQVRILEEVQKIGNLIHQAFEQSKIDDSLTDITVAYRSLIQIENEPDINVVKMAYINILEKAREATYRLRIITPDDHLAYIIPFCTCATGLINILFKRYRRIPVQDYLNDLARTTMDILEIACQSSNALSTSIDNRFKEYLGPQDGGVFIAAPGIWCKETGITGSAGSLIVVGYFLDNVRIETGSSYVSLADRHIILERLVKDAQRLKEERHQAFVAETTNTRGVIGNTVSLSLLTLFTFYDFAVPMASQGLIQNRLGAGNYELVFPIMPKGLVHYTLDNSVSNAQTWKKNQRFATDKGSQAVAMIQSTISNDLEVVAESEGNLFYYYRENNQWHEPPLQIASGVGNYMRKTFSFIERQFGRRKNQYELVYPRADGGLQHIRRESNSHDAPWIEVETFGRRREDYVAVALIHSPLTDDLELLAIFAHSFSLAYYYREGGAWHEHSILLEDIGLGVSLTESAYGSASNNYEAVVSAGDNQGGIIHLWRENSVANPRNQPWNVSGGRIATELGNLLSPQLSLIYAKSGCLELIVEKGIDRLRYRRDQNFEWFQQADVIEREGLHNSWRLQAMAERALNNGKVQAQFLPFFKQPWLPASIGGTIQQAPKEKNIAPPPRLTAKL